MGGYTLATEMPWNAGNPVEYFAVTLAVAWIAGKLLEINWPLRTRGMLAIRVACNVRPCAMKTLRKST